MSEHIAARTDTTSVANNDDDWVDVELWVEEVVLVPQRGQAVLQAPSDTSRVALLAAYAPLRTRSTNAETTVAYYDEQDDAFAEEARLRERDRKQAARLLSKAAPATPALADKRMGPTFQLEAVAAAPAARPAFSQRFGERSSSSLSLSDGAYDPFGGSASPKRSTSSSAAAASVPSSASRTAESLREQKERMEREFRHQQAREAHYEELKRKDPFQAARFLEKMERKRLQPAIDAAARAEKKARKEEQRKERERSKRERDQQHASHGGSSATKKRRDDGKEPDMVAFKANLSSAVATALKPHFVANKIADKDSFKHLCRKLTKTLVQKERERGNAGKWHPKLGSAAARFVDSFMGKLEARGQVYTYVEGQTSDASMLLDTSLELGGSVVVELKAGGSDAQQQAAPTMPPMMF